jgi:hypothetical protein
LTLFFEFVEPGVSAEAQDACGIADAAAMERHSDNLLCDLGSTPLVGRMKQERLVGTGGIGTARALLVGIGFPTFGDVVTLTIHFDNTVMGQQSGPWQLLPDEEISMPHVRVKIQI